MLTDNEIRRYDSPKNWPDCAWDLRGPRESSADSWRQRGLAPMASPSCKGPSPTLATTPLRGSLIDHEYSIAVRAFLLLHILHRKMEASQIATPGRTLHTKPKAWRPSSVPI